MKICKYIRTYKGNFVEVDSFPINNPYWKVIDGKIYSFYSTGQYGTYDYKESLTAVCMSEEEAIKKSCGCYYCLR